MSIKIVWVNSLQDTVTFSFILALWRSFAITFVTLFLILINLPSVLRRNVSAKACETWHRWICKISGLNVSVVGEMETGQHIMFVCNHVSYIDIPVLGKTINGYFVAKSEVRQWPVFGFLAELNRTVFIERRGRKAAEQRSQLADILGNGKNLILFPEGTSSDGSKVLPFKSTLFDAAFSLSDESDLNIKVQPVSIAYKNFKGQKMTNARRDHYAWYGDMTLAGHFWHWLGLGNIEVEISFHRSTTPHEFEDRKKMAKYCEHHTRAGLHTSLKS